MDQINKKETTSSKFLWMFSKTSLTYVLTIFFVSSTIAFFIPVSSLYLSNKLHANELMIGVFFTVQCLLSIIIGMVIAKYSDITGKRIKVVVIGCLCGFLGCLSYAFIPNYWFLLVVINILMGFSSVSNQLFASAREYCEDRGHNSLTFTSVLRAFFASAWIIGPPVAMYLVDFKGFTVVYISCAIAFLITAILSFLFLPRRSFLGINQKAAKTKLFSDHSVIFLFLATVLIFTCNYMYLIAMPQHVTKVLGFETKYVGIFMATAAMCEIPCMLIFSQIAKKISIKYIILFAIISGIIFYTTLGFAHTLSIFLVSQLANAIFIGNITTLGMYYFQELLPEVPGQATTLFSNAIAVGGILSGLLCGVTATALGFSAVFFLGASLSAVAFIFILLVKKVN